MTLLKAFRSAVCICSATSDRWGLSVYFDDVSQRVCDLAKANGLSYWTGDRCWQQLGPFCFDAYPNIRCTMVKQAMSIILPSSGSV
eukprot:16442982-Heterocapsa_arctica.AAC.3